jgi:hypothetical protein
MRFCSILKHSLALLAIILVILYNLQPQNSSTAVVLSQWSYKETDKACSEDYSKAAQFHGFVKNQLEFWKSISTDEILQIQKNILEHLDNIDQNQSRQYTGRGIIYSAFPGALRMISVSIKFLRSYGCTLPVELWC